MSENEEKEEAMRLNDLFRCATEQLGCDWKWLYDELNKLDLPAEQPNSGFHRALSILCTTTLDLVETGKSRDSLRAELEKVKTELAQRVEYHRDGECYICKKQTCSLAGSPFDWPIWFCYGDNSGVTKPFHIGCVTASLHELGKVKGERDRCREALRPFAEYGVAFDSVGPAIRREDNKTCCVPIGHCRQAKRVLGELGE